jgi:hypothetical protein
MHNPSLLIQTPDRYRLFVTGSRKVAPMRGFIIAGCNTQNFHVFEIVKFDLIMP